MQDYRSIVDELKGPLVPILPAFTEQDELDYESTCRWVDWVVDSGIRLLWLTCGTSRYASLTDREIWYLTKAIAEVTRGRALLIAGTNLHWPVGECRRFVDHAAACGASIVKVQPYWQWNPSDDDVFNYYQAIAQDSALPLFAYALPMRNGGPSIGSSLFQRILGLPQFVGMKNDAGDFYEHREYLAMVRESKNRFVVMTGGSMMSFLWGYDFGAQAFCSAFGIIAPQVPLDFYQHLCAGRREEALSIVTEDEEPLVEALAGLGGWGALRVGLVLKGFYSSWRERFPVRTLTDAEAQIVKQYLEAKDLL